MAGQQRKRFTLLAFGVTIDGLADIPNRVGSRRMARMERFHEYGCPFCFPHGRETVNASWKKKGQAWKRRRRTQYRLIG